MQCADGAELPTSESIGNKTKIARTLNLSLEIFYDVVKVGKLSFTMRNHVHSDAKLSHRPQFISWSENKGLLFMSFFIVSQQSAEHGSLFMVSRTHARTHALRIHIHGAQRTHLTRNSHLLRNGQNYKNR